MADKQTTIDTYLQGLKSTLEMCDLALIITSDPQLLAQARKLKAETEEFIKAYTALKERQ